MKKNKLGFAILTLAIVIGFVAAFTLVSCDEPKDDPKDNPSTPVYTPHLTLSAVTFDPVGVGYDRPEPRTVTINNDGTAKANITSVLLDGENADKFELIGEDEIETIEADDTADFEVQPVSGLLFGTYTAKIIVTYDDGEKADTDLSFEVNSKANPEVTLWPTAAGITYGAALSTSTLTGGSSNVDGNFAWTNGTIIPTVTNSGYDVTFTPTDTKNYNPLTNTVTIIVNKAKVAEPELTSNSIEYNGSPHTVTLNPANTALYTLGGNITQTIYGGPYTATVSLVDTDNYEWEGGGIEPLQLNWSIFCPHTNKSDANCISPPICIICGAEEGEKNPSNHTGAGCDPLAYVIKPSGTASQYTVTMGLCGDPITGADNHPIETVITFIRTAANNSPVTIQFGNGTDTLDIGTESVNFNTSNGTWGLITLRGKITSEHIGISSGTIVIANNVSINSEAYIANTPVTGFGNAIHSEGSGTIAIIGGTVTATGSNGTAINYFGSGKITISGEHTLVSSARTASAGTNTIGTITIAGTTGSGAVLEINGGTIQNTANHIDGRAIHNAGNRAVHISGGTVLVAGTGNTMSYAVEHTNAAAALVLNGSPVITGGLRVTPGMLSVAAGFTPGDNIYSLDFASYSDDMVAVLNGKDFIGNFNHPKFTNGSLEESGNNLTFILDPFLVYTEEDLRAVGRGGTGIYVVGEAGEKYADWLLSASYKQMENITLTSDWTRIGLNSATYYFTGTYNGNGKTITNLSMNSTAASASYNGMFAGIGTTGVVRNLGLVNVNISFTGSSSNHIGGIAGQNTGKIENCYVTGSITGVSNVGGLAGSCQTNNSMISGSYSTANVTARDTVGGLVGLTNSTITIINCYATGNITASGEFAGGLVGNNSNTSPRLVTSYATGNVSGTNNVGGLVGNNGAVNRNSVALNHMLIRSSGTNSDFGRVCGKDSRTISNSFGRTDMLFIDGEAPDTFEPATAVASSASGIHGGDVTVEQANTETWWTSQTWSTTAPAVRWTFDETSAWEWGANNLPILRNMPGGNEQNHTLQVEE